MKTRMSAADESRVRPAGWTPAFCIEVAREHAAAGSTVISLTEVTGVSALCPYFYGRHCRQLGLRGSVAYVAESGGHH